MCMLIVGAGGYVVVSDLCSFEIGVGIEVGIEEGMVCLKGT